MPEKPSPKIADTVNSPISFCVSANAMMHKNCHADPISTVEQSADAVRDPAPHLTAEERGAEQHRQHDGIGRGEYAEIGAERHEMRLRHRHRNAAAECRNAQHHEHEIGRPAEHRRPAVGARLNGGGRLDLGRFPQEQRSERQDHGELEQSRTSASFRASRSSRSSVRRSAARARLRCTGRSRSARAPNRGGGRTSG